MTRRSLLASLMALSLLCGGLGAASAVDVVHVDESETSTTEVYTKAKVDTLLDGKADKTAVEEIKNTVGGVDSGLVKKTDDNATRIEVNKTNINTLKDTVGDDTKGLTKKINDNTAAIAMKADTAAVTTLEGRVGDVEGKVTTLEGKVGDASSGLVKDVTALETTVGDASSGLVKDVNDLRNQGNTLNTALGSKADQSDLVAATNRITANEGNITELQRKTTNIDYDVANQTTSINGMKVGQQVDMGGKDLTNVGTINGIDLGTKEGGKYISQDGSIWGNLKTVDTQVKTNADAIAKETADRKAAIGELTVDGKYIKKDKNVSDNLVELDKQAKTNADAIAQETADRKAAIGELAVNGNYIKKDNNVSDNLVELDKQAKTNADAIADTNQRTAGITRDDTRNETSIEGKVTVDQNGNIKAEGAITSNGLNAGAGDIKTTGKVSAGDVSTGTLETTGNAKISGDLTVNGKLNVDKISLKNGELKNGKKHDSATTITADEISNLAKVTEQGNTTESQFTHNEKGTFNYAKDEKSTGEWKRATSNVTADGVSNKMTDSDGNTHTYYQTAAETKEQLVNGDKSNFEKKTAEGNTISIKDKDADGNKKSLTNTQTVDGEKTSVTNKDSSSTINQGADQIRYNVTSKDENKTSSSIEVKADGITNTSKDGTITNDAKDIVNNASGNISNKSQTMDTTVTGKATESYGELETTVNGNETHTVTGNQDIHVTGKQTNTVEGGQENIISGGQTNTITGDQTTTITGNKTETVEGKLTENFKGGQETNVTGDQVITVSGTQTTTATDINRNASSGMIDTIDNDYGTNTETKVAGKTTTDVSIKGTGEEGKYIRGANESRDYLIKGTLKNSETKTVEKTSTEITDGNGKTSSTIQDVKNLAGSVTNGTETGVSGIHAKDDGSVSIDSAVTDVTDRNKYSVINQKKGSIQSTVVDGTNSTVILQDKDNVTIASSNGMVGLVGKDIVNNAQNTITNTAGTSITNQVNDSKVTTDANGTTFENNTPAVSDGGTTTTKINGNHINTGRVDANELGVSDKDDQGNTADFSVKAGEGIKGSVTDKDGNKTYTTVTATENSFQVQDKDGNIKNHQVNTKDKSENTIKNGDKTNIVTSTADGTTFNNSEAAAPVTGASGAGTHLNTTIKGNTITTGKVTMDYAEVMKDLGVTGKTTTGSLEVKGESKLTGKVTMESDATVGGKLDVTGKATFGDDVDITKNLSVVGDVTANSYKVGDKTYIDANGIHANNQKITDVADGSISEGSKDAVNGGQLYGVKNDLEGKVNKVGANAAAMANLHPMEFDPDSKWNIAAAIGNYGSETAAALGAFYRPNDDVMVNLSTAFGTGENMVGGGVSVRLGKGGNKLSREETNALKAQVADLTARMDALLSVLNPNMSKDFPDVPENHWAYEAVSRLAGNDIVQGYPDGEFHGERTMTRYEMAEIIYNALSRGAEAEKELVEEFKPELQAMAASEKATAEKAEG